MADPLSNAMKQVRVPLRVLRKKYDQQRRLSAWRALVERTRDVDQFQAKPDGPRIVIFAVVGNMFLTNVEIPLALALNARGANVEIVFDDATLPLCELTTQDVVEKGQAEFCRRCVDNVRAMMVPLPLKVRFLGELCPPLIRTELLAKASCVHRDELLSCRESDIPFGRAAAMVAMRHFRIGQLDMTNPQHEQTLRNYIGSGMIAAHAASKLVDESPIHAAAMSHGIYSSWEPALEVFKSRGIPVAVYDRQTGIDRYQFNWNLSPNTGDISAAWDGHWRDAPLTAQQRSAAVNYIADRQTFRAEGAKFSSAPPQSTASIRRQLSLPEHRTLLLLLSNLVWDAAAVGRDLIFTDTVQWVCNTIEAVAARREKLFLIVKPHPAEVMRGTKLFVADEVRRVYGSLPTNVLILPARNDINPMSLMQTVDVGICHTSTAGLEMAALGKPVIPVSMAHYRGKGFTFDPRDRHEYRALISQADALPTQFTPPMRELALKYVYVRYFLYQHELPITRERGFLNCVGYKLSSLDDLLPGRMPDLDFVCRTILLRGSSFVRDE